MAQMRETAIQVNSLLTAYIAIHDDIYGASIRKIIPIPGIFRKINYCQHMVLLEQISSQLQVCEAEAMKGFSEGGAQARFASALAQYTRALNATVTHLQRMTDLLCRKAQGEHCYSRHAYNSDCDQYNQLVQQYIQMGDSLNEVVRS
ncbi:MAG TPA: hypothetical protein VGL40_08420 [Bacillota bacterium]|jgi:uncharacterized protein YukE